MALTQEQEQGLVLLWEAHKARALMDKEAASLSTQMAPRRTAHRAAEQALQDYVNTL